MSASEMIRPGPGRASPSYTPVFRAKNIHTLADEELMALVQDADARAFEMLYDRHGGAVFSLAYRIVGDRIAAQDISQEAFLSIWRSRLRYRPEYGSVRTWVLGIVHHRAIDALRRNTVHQRRRAAADTDDIEERQEAPEHTDAEAIRREEAASIRAALAGLPKEQCRVIELAYFGGFTHTEIADMLELPVGTVKGRMRLGLGKLRLELGGIAA